MKALTSRGRAGLEEHLTFVKDLQANTAKVMKNMKRNLKQRGTELIPIPEGDSLSVLAPLKGNTKLVMGFSTVGVLMLWSGMVSKVST